MGRRAAARPVGAARPRWRGGCCGEQRRVGFERGGWNVWDKLNATTLLEILDHVPGVVYASLLDPMTGEMSWLYFSPDLGPMFGMSNEEVVKDPGQLLRNYYDDDRAKLEQGTVAALS